MCSIMELYDANGLYRWFELCWGKMVPVSNLQFASILVFFFWYLSYIVLPVQGEGHEISFASLWRVTSFSLPNLKSPPHSPPPPPLPTNFWPFPKTEAYVMERVTKRRHDEWRENSSFFDSICQLVVDDKRSRKALEKGQCSSTASLRRSTGLFLAVHIFHVLCSARLVLACI